MGNTYFNIILFTCFVERGPQTVARIPDLLRFLWEHGLELPPDFEHPSPWPSPPAPSWDCPARSASQGERLPLVSCRSPRPQRLRRP